MTQKGSTGPITTKHSVLQGTFYKRALTASCTSVKTTWVSDILICCVPFSLSGCDHQYMRPNIRGWVTHQHPGQGVSCEQGSSRQHNRPESRQTPFLGVSSARAWVKSRETAGGRVHGWLVANRGPTSPASTSASPCERGPSSVCCLVRVNSLGMICPRSVSFSILPTLHTHKSPPARPFRSHEALRGDAAASVFTW